MAIQSHKANTFACIHDRHAVSDLCQQFNPVFDNHNGGVHFLGEKADGA